MGKILRKIFGPNKDEIWKQLSNEIGADFVEGGFWKGSSKVVAQVKNWTVTLDTYTVSTGKSSITFTRMRAPYVNRDGFRFNIYRKRLLSGLGKLLGMQDIEIGGPKFERLEPLFGVPSYLDEQLIESGLKEFDEAFIIKSNDETKARMLFKNWKLREMIEAQPQIFFQIKDDEGWFGKKFPEGVDELYFQVVGIITDIEHLKSIYELFAETLNTLCHIGSAYETDPNLDL
jgi:hypothetical protein